MSTLIPLAAFAFLNPASEASRPKCTQHSSLPAPVVDYLEAHIANLVRRAASEDAPPAQFHDGGDALFDELEAKSGKEFVAVAERTAAKLQGEMDERAKPGLFVALKRQPAAGGPTVAILKLDVVEEHAGALVRENGLVTLKVVEDVLELTGTLQKGAAVPDPRAGSQVIVGEKSGGAASQYFLRALKIRQTAPPVAGTHELIKAIHKVQPERLEETIDLLGESSAATVEEFLDEAGPLLLNEEREAVLSAVTSMTHQVVQILPAKATRSITGEGITISGRADDMESKVTLRELPGKKWRAEVIFQQRPQERYA